MSYSNYAYANVKNNSGVPLKSLTLFHQYSNDTPESMTWNNVAPGAVTTLLKVGYNTGIIHYGQDYWWVQYTLPDDSVWVADDHGHMHETLHLEDQGTTKTFSVHGSWLNGFSHAGPELPHSIQLHLKASPHYNSWAPIVIRNDFPVQVSVLLKHKYSNDANYEKRWPPLAAGATTSPDQAFIAYYNTGIIRTGSDHWNVSVKFDIPPYDNAPATAFDAISNATSDKGCMLKASDNGDLQTFTIDGSVLRMGIDSGACTDDWHTWHGYNTLAFICIKNDFGPTISTVVLNHQYSDDTTWQQTRALIPAGGTSSWMVAEYNTGILRTGLDYWNVSVYLENGKWYRNRKSSKECLLRTADAVKPSTFTVSDSTFTLGLNSGACTDSMDEKGDFSPNAGRDVTKRYDENAFIGSHNAFANFEAGYWFAQQTDGVQIQLAKGGTTLLLDIWYDHVVDDICLLHAGENVNLILQPFASTQKLSDVLGIIKNYLALQSRDPVTIVFEDRVKDPYQHLIRKAFEKSGTWSMTFNPDSYGVQTKGWPTLAEFFTMKTPLIVLTSNDKSADFAYQWKYMSENVYGDASLDQATWLNARGESKPLNDLALCALNHFPSWSFDGIGLPAWLVRAAADNDVVLLTKMIDACYTKWKRYPNYVNADFWEIPTNGLIEATVYMNKKLRGLPYPVLRFENGRAILSEIDDSRQLLGNWNRAAGWIDHHFDEICPRLDPGRPGPIVYQLGDAINLAVVVSTLHSVLPADENTVTPWVHKLVSQLVHYLHAIEPAVIVALGADTAATDELCAIPYFLIERASGTTFDVTDIVRRGIPATTAPAGHDQLLLAGLAGRADVAAQLTERLAATRIATAEASNFSRIYDLTHEIFYLALTGAGIPHDGLGENSLSAHVQMLLGKVMPANQDLGAELLACYWLAGGIVTADSRDAVRQLKAFSEDQPAECATGQDGQCRCAGFKEQIHGRLTMVLGLGTTLTAVPQILDHPDQPPA